VLSEDPILTCKKLLIPGKLFVWGTGSHGQLGHDRVPVIPSPKPLLVFPDNMPTSLKVKEVSCGQNHTLILTDNSRLFSFGLNSTGQLGQGHFQSLAVPTQIHRLPQRPKHIQAGGYHSCFLSDQGEVFVCGFGIYGQLGLDSTENANVFKHLLLGKSIIQVACGYTHTAFLTEDNEVLTCGNGAAGQLGHGDRGERHTPTLVKALAGTRVVHICCGMESTFFVNVLGDVHVCGCQFQPVGQGDDEMVELLTPKPLPSLHGKGVCSIAAGRSIAVALSVAGEVTVLGSGCPPPADGDERRMSLSQLHKQWPGLAGKKFIQAACGGDFFMLLSSAGELFTFGENSAMQLGHGDTADLYTPKPVQALKNRKISSVSAGATHSCAVAAILDQPILPKDNKCVVS